MAQVYPDSHILLPVPQVGGGVALRSFGAEAGSVMELHAHSGPPSRRASGDDIGNRPRPLSPLHASSQQPRRGSLKGSRDEGSKPKAPSRRVSIQTGHGHFQSSTESSFHDLMMQALVEHDREVRDLRRQITHSGDSTPTENKSHNDPKKYHAELEELLHHRLDAAGDADMSRSGRKSHTDPDMKDLDVANSMKVRSRSASLPKSGSAEVKSVSLPCSARCSAVPSRCVSFDNLSNALTKKGSADGDKDEVMFVPYDLWTKEETLYQKGMRTQMSFASLGTNTAARTRSMFSANLGEHSPVAPEVRKASLSSGSTIMTAGGNAVGHLLRCIFCYRSRGCWRFLDRLVVYPNSISRIFWDILGSVFLMLDILLVPLEAFQQERSFEAVEIINWIALIFWTTDIVATQFVGYTEGGVLEMRFKYIVLHYCRTWLLVDSILVGLDWTFVVANRFAEVASLSGLMRLLRLLRILRLVRMLKMSRIMRELSDLLASEHTSIVVNITRLILILLVVNHGVACCWFWLGTLNRADTPNWVENYGVDESSFAYRYFTSMHWSLAQFTPGSMEIHPWNVAERVYNVCVLVFGLLVFSCFVSSMTNHFMRLKALVENESQQFWLLRCYLKQHRAPTPLCSRIYRHVEFMLKKRNDVLPAAKVKLLEYVSSDLMNELAFAMFKDVVIVHPFFFHLWRLSDVVMMRICGIGVSNQMFARGDAIFFQAETGTSPYFMMSGTAIYKVVKNNANASATEGDPSDDEEGTHEVVESEQIIAEASLWTPSWVHRGRLHAKTECTLVSVDSDTFRSVIEASPPLWHFVRFYAINYVGWLNQQSESELSDIFDMVLFKWQLEAFLPDLEELAPATSSPSFAMMSSLNSALGTIRESLINKTVKTRVSALIPSVFTGGSKDSKLSFLGPDLLRPPEAKSEGRHSARHSAGVVSSPSCSSFGASSTTMSD